MVSALEKIREVENMKDADSSVTNRSGLSISLRPSGIRGLISA